METEPANVKIETVIPSKPSGAPPSQWWTVRVYESGWGEWLCLAYPSLDRASKMHDHYTKHGKRVDPVIHSVTMPEPFNGN